jgi:transposase
MASKQEERDMILDLAAAGHSPRTLALQFGLTEWTIRRWMAHARRQAQLPYWRNMTRASDRETL